MTVARQLRLLVLLLACPFAHGQSPTTSNSQAISQPLEVHIVDPPDWKNYCLEVNIKRTNRSRSPIFLPSFAGVLIYSSVTDATNTLGQGTGVAWFPVYGMTDIIDPSVTRLAPGETKRDTYCIWDTFPVVDSEKKMRRQVRLQGNLRIYASYYRETPNWQISKQRREEMAQTPPSKWKNADRWNGGRVMAEISIPCPKGTSKPDCTIPPPIFQGEHSVPIPDVGE
jgi:hypothetical protein